MRFTSQNPPQGYYVYAYYQLDDSSPYYIGKGYHKRAWKKHTIPKPDDARLIVVLESNLTEIGAWAIERRLIEWYGRTVNGSGILMNITKGGPAGYCYKGRPGKKTKNKNPYPHKGKTYEEFLGEYAEVKKAKLRAYFNTTEGKQHVREAGLKGAQHILESGWSADAIAKRVRTRKVQGTYRTDMSACHTPEAIAKRTQTRMQKGVRHNTAACNSAESRFKRQRTKLLAMIEQLETKYNRPFSRQLLKTARKDRVSYLKDETLYRYLTADELVRYGYESDSNP
jgi:hypothetical protein